MTLNRYDDQPNSVRRALTIASEHTEDACTASPKSLIMNLGTNFEGHHLDQKILGAGPESEQTTQNQEISQYFDKFLNFFFVDRFRTDPEKILNRP